jgi:CubicO group peptidase (beta-lactamase class C family)
MELVQLIKTLDAAIERLEFSGVISIRQHGAVLYERAAGYADRSNKILNTLETRFGIASGTKFLTALAIGKLIETGKLSFTTVWRSISRAIRPTSPSTICSPIPPAFQIT